MTAHPFAWKPVAAAAIAMIAAGCASSEVRSEKEADAQRAALVGRANALRSDLSGRPDATRELRSRFNRLAADVKSWQRRTGRDDLRNDSIREPGPVALDNDGGGEGGTCEPCKAFSLSENSICFLVDEGECDPDECDPEVDECVLTVGDHFCQYSCIRMGSEPEATTG